MSKYDIVSPRMLRQLLDYDPDTGLLTWLPRSNPRWDARFAGSQAFTCIQDGYAVGTILRKPFLAHTVAYAHFYGKWPAECVDHINRNRRDNRIANLREVPKSDNNKNRSLSRNNTSGVTGVSWNRCCGLWESYISGPKGRKRIGMFATLEKAAAVRKQAEYDYGYDSGHGMAQR